MPPGAFALAFLCAQMQDDCVRACAPLVRRQETPLLARVCHHLTHALSQVSQQNLPPHQNLQPHISNIGHLAHPQQAHRATAMDSKRACPLGGPAGIRHTADYFKSLGYRCPHCDRDFTAMSVNARNGSMTRHMKKCAAEKAGRPLSTGEGGVRAAPAATLDDKGSGRRPSYPPATKGGAVDSADIAGVVQGGNESGWWVRGSEYLGRRVRRAVYDEDSGEIVGAGILFPLVLCYAERALASPSYFQGAAALSMMPGVSTDS